MKDPTPRLSIVLPAYCEAGHLAESLAVIRTHAADLGVPYELVVVDDGSPDDTWQVLQTLARQWPELRAFRLARNFGKEGCLLAGLEASRGEAVIVMDSDMQHPPELIGRMYRLWADEKYDVVNAVKVERGDETWTKRRLTRLYYGLFARLAGVDIGDSSDFKLLSRHVVETYCRLPERNTFFRGLVTWMGFRQTDIPFNVAARAGGTTSWSFLKLMRLAINSMVNFSTIPLQAVTLLGITFLIFGLALAADTLWLKLSGQAVEGFTTVILLLLIIGAVLMIALGIIGQYVARIFDEVKRRPRYLIREQSGSQTARLDPASDKDRKDRTIRESDPVA
jgi:glycosyltransferase involved in cell wall biosynthesis